MNSDFKRTKIMATIGPATWDAVNGEKKIEAIMKAGVDIYRLNFSHGTYEEKTAQIRDIRKVAEKLGRRVAIVQDLQGPKVRLGDVKDDSLFVKTGDELVLDYALRNAVHDGSFTIPLQYDLARKVKIGEIIYIFDGKIRTKIIEVPSKTAIKVKVLNDGEIKRKKGVNLPDTDFGKYVFPQKDLDDMAYGHDKDIDYVAFSFIQSADDMKFAKKILKEKGYPDAIKVIAKVETRQATSSVEIMDAIVEESHAIMVARGDMAYEVEMAEIPTIQRILVKLCREKGKPVIVATQTMGSMVDSPIPTRAEADNVTAAVLMGADAIMLSEETAVGQFPIETVSKLKSIIMFTQNNNDLNNIESNVKRPDPRNTDKLCKAAMILATELGVDGVVTQSRTGWTPMMASAQHANVRIISVTDSPLVANQMVLHYGIDSYCRTYGKDYGAILVSELMKAGKFKPRGKEAHLVVVSGQYDGNKYTCCDTIQFRVIK